MKNFSLCVKTPKKQDINTRANRARATERKRARVSETTPDTSEGDSNTNASKVRRRPDISTFFYYTPYIRSHFSIQSNLKRKNIYEPKSGS